MRTGRAVDVNAIYLKRYWEAGVGSMKRAGHDPRWPRSKCVVQPARILGMRVRKKDSAR